jgi:hypothetical protein
MLWDDVIGSIADKDYQVDDMIWLDEMFVL